MLEKTIRMLESGIFRYSVTFPLWRPWEGLWEYGEMVGSKEAGSTIKSQAVQVLGKW